MSVLASKFGADWSLLWSPLNTKLCCELELEMLPLEAELLAPPEVFSKLQGTATCLLPLLLDELAPGEEDDAEELPALDASLVDALELPPVTDRIAKSTLPELGLIRTSLIVPMVLPEDEVTLALFRSAALIS